jgi:hypothetical protein
VRVRRARVLLEEDAPMKSHCVFAAALVLAAAVTAQAQAVKVEFLMGKVNLTAQNASVRAIVTEWARVGGVRVVNPERLSAAPVTLQFTGVPERQVLDILLRDVGGYLLGPRQTALVPGISAFDRLVVVTATPGPAPRPAPAGANVAQRPNVSRRPAVIPPPEPDQISEPISEPEPDEPPQGGVPVPNRQNIRPALMPPLPQAEAPPATPAPAPSPGNPFGVQGSTKPGVIAPVPQTTTAPRPNEQ